MKKIILGVCSFCLLNGSTAFAQSSSSLADATTTDMAFETYKRDQVNIQLWIKQHPHVKILSAQDFVNRSKKDRDYMLMHGVLIYDGTELGMDDIQRFNQGQRPERVQQFLNEETALAMWLQMHPNVLILSRERYNTMSADDKAVVDGINDKIIYNGAQLMLSDVSNF